MPTGVTSEWTDWQANLLGEGRKHIPRVISELEEFSEFCSKAVAKGPREKALRIVTALAENLHLAACRKLLGPIVALKIKGRGKKSWLESCLDSVSASRLSLSILELCTLLARQLPTARAVGSLIQDKHIAELHMNEYPEKAAVLDFYLHFPTKQSHDDLLADIDALQEAAFGLGQQELALSSVSDISDPVKLTVLLERLDRKQFRALANKVGLQAKLQAFLSKYQLRTLQNAPGVAPTTGIYLSIGEYLFAIRRQLEDRVNASVDEQAARLRFKLATGTFKYGAPASFKTRRVLPIKVGDLKRTVVFEVSIDGLDLSEQGQQVFGALEPGDPVVLLNDKKTAIAWVEPGDKLLVRGPEFEADSIMVPWGYSSLIKEYYDSLEPIEVPEWLVGPLIGLGYNPEPGDSAQSFVDANELAVIVGEEDVKIPGRGLVLGSNRAAGRGTVYSGASLVPLLCNLLDQVSVIAKENNLDKFYTRTCQSAFYIARRLDLMSTPLFQELEKLAPLEVLDPSQHEDFLVNGGADTVVVKNLERGKNFTSIVVKNAGNMSDVHLLKLLSSNKNCLQKLVLCGQPVATTNLFTRLVDQGKHYCRSPAVSADIFAQTSDWYPGKTIVGCGDLPGFACTVQAIAVGGHETISQPPFVSNTASAEYAILLYQYLLLKGYDATEIVILADGEGQRQLIEKLWAGQPRGEFFRPPQVTVDPSPAAVIIASWTGLGVEQAVCYARRGAFLIFPGDSEGILEIVGIRSGESGRAKPVTVMDMHHQVAGLIAEMDQQGKPAAARGAGKRGQRKRKLHK